METRLVAEVVLGEAEMSVDVGVEVEEDEELQTSREVSPCAGNAVNEDILHANAHRAQAKRCKSTPTP